MIIPTRLRDVFGFLVGVVFLGMIFVGCNRRAREMKAGTDCYANLMAIGPACSMYRLEHNGKFVTEISTNAGGSKEFVLRRGSAFRHFQPLVREYLPPHFLVCPVDDRESASNWQAMRNDNISYFLSLNFDPQEKNTILAGDRNAFRVGNTIQGFYPGATKGWNASLGLHGTNGFVLFMDGHAEYLSSAGLLKAIGAQGSLTNWVEIP